MELKQEVATKLFSGGSGKVVTSTPTLPGLKRPSGTTKGAILLLTNTEISSQPLPGLLPLPYMYYSMSFLLDTGQSQECCMPRPGHPELGS